MRSLLPAALAVLVLPGAVGAATVGLPIFATAPTNVQVTNDFGGSNLPGPFSLSFTAPIASAQGAPELVGEVISVRIDDTAGPDEGTFVIGGTEYYNGSGTIFDFTVSLLVLPGEVSPGVFAYDPLFSGFITPATSPDGFAIDLIATIDKPLPAQTFRAYDFTDAEGGSVVVERDDAVASAFVDGRPVAVVFEQAYFDGPVEGAVVTFSTVGGAPVPPVPLPAGAWLLASALGGLALTRRARA